MILADYITNRSRRLHVLGVGIQSKFRHRVDNSALNGFQSITDMRQCAIVDHVHGVVQVGVFSKLGERNGFQLICHEIRSHELLPRIQLKGYTLTDQ